MKTFIIIPVYNESEMISSVLQSLSSLDACVIVVDDGSIDTTPSIISNFPVISIRHELNIGQGAAIETGMEAARMLDADFVIHFDADGQHDASDIEYVLHPLQADSADIVYGSRFLGKKSNGLPLFRKITLKTARWVNYLLTGVLLSDAHNGLRGLNRMALDKIRIQQPGMAHATEILSLSKKNHLRITEVPVHIHYTAYSLKKGTGFLSSINILFHLLFKKK